VRQKPLYPTLSVGTPVITSLSSRAQLPALGAALILSGKDIHRARMHRILGTSHRPGVTLP
jgi:hypothetical protein